MELTCATTTSNFLFLEADKFIEMRDSQKGAFLTASPWHLSLPQREDILNLSFSLGMLSWPWLMVMSSHHRLPC